ncbi:hypothetical protein G7085_05675 [Tessaracoccus sp. HDW20]|uniref:hypothetical protein n=1 Tax=Tessaracoccus coleopterorum TaxID=2714950 RepID=UPI0018D29696|nr:hypothetical protein [Tessaracoccus coleopterorum]NHB84279.1 hypothetical protein [Tessaracoccus coleopterorum]
MAVVQTPPFPAALDAAVAHGAALADLQAPSGLFTGGDNLESPPDSGFTLNDLGDAVEVIRRADPAARSELAVLESLLVEIADNARAAMLAGGVHTPNHRWELASALARLHRMRPDGALVARAEEWLGEGIDIDGDAQYSERSATYASHVTNPSLTLLAEVLDRPELLGLVERNLVSSLGLIRRDATIETIHSRRQDQKDPRHPLDPYVIPLRRAALATGRGDLAWAAGLACSLGIGEPHAVLAALLLDPTLGEELPPAAAPGHGTFAWPQSRLVIHDDPGRRLVVYAGSDFARQRRIRSGLANNPTFLRLECGEVLLESVRLSRDFFGLGPFRPGELRDLDGAHLLVEDLAGGYYQPLAPGLRRADGAYDLVDEGRFSASMSFGQREADEVRLHTEVSVTPTADGVDLTVTTDGPQLGWALELAFREGGAFEGCVELGDGSARLDEGVGRYVVGTSAIEFGPGTGERGSAHYSAGEEYEYVGGTDAMGGPRVYLTGRAPGVARISLRGTYA